MTRSPARRAAPRRRGHHAGFLTGLVLLVLALAALGWSAYDVLWRPPVDQEDAARTVADLRGHWALGVDPLAAVAELEAGDPVAIVRVPQLGDEEWPLLAGTDDATLVGGLGWYDQTAAPGEIGNLAIAGLGELRGPFADLGTLSTGDEVVVETRSAVFTYTITNEPADTVVAAADTWVIQPVPGQPEKAPTEALLTLTTDGGAFQSGTRTVAWATLTDTQPK